MLQLYLHNNQDLIAYTIEDRSQLSTDIALYY